MMTRPMPEPPGALMKKILPYRLRRALRVHGPRRNHLPMAVVSLNDGTPDPRAGYSLTAYQLLGGRRWSLHPGIIPGAEGAAAPGRASQCR